MKLLKVKRIKQKHLDYLLSFCATFSINTYLFGFERVDFKSGLIGLFLFWLVVFLADNRPKSCKKELQVHKIAYVSAIFLAFVMTLGNFLYRMDSLLQFMDSPMNILRTLSCIVGASWVFFLLLERLMFWFRGYEWILPEKNEWRWFGGDLRSLFFCWGAIFLCWVPCLLAYFPGIFSYDAPPQLLQAEGFMRLDDMSPILHTLFLKLCFTIGGSHQNGILVYSIIQMTLMSFCFSFTLFYLSRLGMHYKIRILAFIWFALSPFNAVFSLVTAKDVLCGGILILLTVIMTDLAINPEKFFISIPKQSGVVILCLLFSLLRNNALHAVIITTILMLIIYRKYWKGVLRTFGVAALTAYLIMIPLFSALDLKYKSSKEMLSVPAQQIALVSKNHWVDLSDEEHESILKLFKVNAGELYNPRNADPVKAQLEEANLKEFFSLWQSLFKKYPREYLEAFLTLNLPYWYPDAAYPDKYSNRQYIEDSMREVWSGSNIERRSLSKPLLSFYESFSQKQASWMELPLISTICSVGTPIWIMFTIYILLLTKRRGRMAVVLLPTVAFWLTFMLGPLSNLRYMYPLIASYPVYIALVGFIARRNQKV